MRPRPPRRPAGGCLGDTSTSPLHLMITSATEESQLQWGTKGATLQGMRIAHPTVSPPRGFVAAAAGSPYELRRRDGRVVAAIKRGVGAVRDLQAALIQLARTVEGDRKIEWGCLVVVRGRMTAEKAFEEWTAIVERLLDAKVRKRLALIWIEQGSFRVRPDTPELQALGASLQDSLEGIEAAWKERRTSMTPALFEVLKVLLHAWLLGRGPLAVGEIQSAAGVAYGTVSNALEFLEDRREVARTSDRSAELSGFPTASWSEVLALSESLRRPAWYADRSGRPLDPEFLLERLQKRVPEGVAAGGVVAARHWDPSFNLNGTPRLDVTLHALTGPSLANLLARIDPSLEKSSRLDERTVLVVHPLSRRETLFERVAAGPVAIADPVETLLDLIEMRLVSQAEDLVRALRKGHDSTRP